jgi:hypothetical protein
MQHPPQRRHNRRRKTTKQRQNPTSVTPFLPVFTKRLRCRHDLHNLHKTYAFSQLEKTGTLSYFRLSKKHRCVAAAP